MSQHDQNIANDTGAAVRTDINNALGALFTLSSGAAAPATTIAHMLWVDTTSGTLKRRNAANTGWIVVHTIDESFVLARSSNTILDGSDVGKAIVATGTFTQTLTAAATLGDGWWCGYRNDGAGVTTIDPNGAETIDGGATITLQPGEACFIYCDGTSFKTIGRRVINNLTADATPDGAADYAETWDASAGAHKKVLLDDFPLTKTPVHITVNTTLGATHFNRLVVIDAALTVTLPLISGIPNGTKIWLKTGAASGTAILVQRSGTNTISWSFDEGLVSVKMRTHGDHLVLMADNVAGRWQVVAESIKTGFSVHKNGTDQTAVATGTDTKVTWATELFDFSDDFDIATNERFTCTIPGTYALSGCARWNTVVDQVLIATRIYKNGAVLHSSEGLTAGAGAGQGRVISANVDLVVNDYVELFAHQQTGANRDINGSADLTWFTGTRVR